MFTAQPVGRAMACFILSALCCGCGGQSSTTMSEAEVTITGAGSTFAAPIIQKWSAVYRKRHPEVLVEYEATGSGKGESRFRDGEIDFGGTDAGLSSAELSAVEGGAVQIPITAGILVLAYNPAGLPADLNLPRDVYVDAFLGKPTKWNDKRIVEANPGKELPDQVINVVVRLDSSGTTYAFTNHLAAISNVWREQHGNQSPSSADDLGVKSLDWPGATMSAPGNSGVAGKIKQTLYSIGYVQYGAAREVELGMASLENRAGKYVSPSGTSGLETLLNAKLPADLLAYFPDPEGEYSYPIVTFTWLLARKQYDSKAKTNEVKEFIAWCLTTGQDYSEAAGNVRLAPHVVRSAEMALDAIKAKAK